MDVRGVASSRDRRANIRLHRVLAIELECEGEFRSTVAVDLSVTGFQVATRFPLTTGQVLPVKVYLRNGPRVEGTAEVVWCEKLELSLYRIGCQFEEMRSEDDLARLCAYIEKERLNAEGLVGDGTLELASQVTLRGITATELDRFSVLVRISEILNSCYRLDEVLERALKITVEATGAERGMVLLDRGEEDFAIPAFHALTSGCNIDYSRSVVNRVLQTGKPLLSLDAQKDERLLRSSSLKVMGTRSVLCLTIGAGERKFGMIYLDSSIRAGAFTEIDLRLASVIAGMAASAIERAEYFSQLAQNEKLASMGNLMAGLMHELRNPLSSILGISELLNQERSEELTRDLLEEAERCQRLVQDLLRLSRKEPARFTKVDLAAIVHSAVGAVRSELQRRDIKLSVDISEGSPPLDGHADHLRQVLLNLLSNAVFAVSEVDDPTVGVSLKAGADVLRLQVIDNGAGLPQGNGLRVFDPFFTTKPRDSGTGLGLSIVHRIVMEHGGTIIAENRPGGGAQFTITLPLERGDAIQVS